MNKKAALAELAANLEEYLQHGFRFHPSFMEDFKQLLYDASGHEKEIFALLIKQFHYVKTLGKQVYQADGNEIIKYLEKEYYSLHLSGKNLNLRLLMTFDAENNPVFLAAFYERGGKKSSDYTSWKKVLNNRYSQMQKGVSE
jgi:mRNA-degrading endonuclease RelE of RelBE toxin-antitoxin system